MKKYLIIIVCILNAVVCNAQWVITHKNINTSYQEILNPICGVDARFEINILFSENLLPSINSYRFDAYDSGGNLIKTFQDRKIGSNIAFTATNLASAIYVGSEPLATTNHRPPYIIVKYTFKDINKNVILVCSKKIYTCETDYDLDGIPNNIDNCIYTLNPDQADQDADGIGDFCDDDIDGDGKTNSSDNCPLVYNPNQSDQDGDGKGDVCDSVLDKSDLTIKKSNVIITSQCLDCNSSLADLGSKRHILAKEAGILNIQQIVVDNIGIAQSNISNIKMYLSSDQVVSSDDFYFNTYDISLAKIPSNSYLVKNKSVFGSDIPYNKAYGNCYILLVVDKDNLIVESDEANNLIAIPIYYKQNNFSSKLSVSKKAVNVNVDLDLYTIRIFNLKGNEVLIKKVSSLEEENNVISNLPKDFYIIKYENGSFRKIY